MRSDEERIAALHRRAAELEKQKRFRRTRIMQISSVAACLVVIILLAAAMPGITALYSPQAVQESMNASIFTDSNALGFIVIAVLSFLLGVTATIFCFRLKKYRDEEERK